MPSTFTNMEPAPGRVFSSSFTLSSEEDGLHALSFFAQDILGNREVSRSTAVAVDNTAPETELAISSPAWEGFVSSRAMFVLSAEDPVRGGVASGVDWTKYGVNSSTLTQGLASAWASSRGPTPSSSGARTG